MKKRPLTVTVVVLMVALLVIIAYVLLPMTSPFASIRDTDGDGHADADDAYPNDCAEWIDSDKDGFGDNSD
jgi:hypothetical protein